MRLKPPCPTAKRINPQRRLPDMNLISVRSKVHYCGRSAWKLTSVSFNDTYSKWGEHRDARLQGKCCSGYSMTIESMGPRCSYQIMGIDLTGGPVSPLHCGAEMSKPLECKRVV
ncbi:hypothetical protein LB506_011138 [Fusarium annulatum]|nr:hypothetical protein LB506_011138 [Fusarium annulatum]